MRYKDEYIRETLTIDLNIWACSFQVKDTLYEHHVTGREVLILRNCGNTRVRASHVSVDGLIAFAAHTITCFFIDGDGEIFDV